MLCRQTGHHRKDESMAASCSSPDGSSVMATTNGAACAFADSKSIWEIVLSGRRAPHYSGIGPNAGKNVWSTARET